MTHRLSETISAIPTRVGLKAAGDRRRAETERFIHHCFAHAYAADVQRYLPILLALRDAGGTLQGALGLRDAVSGPLFLEHYLDQPIEQTLRPFSPTPVDRCRVTEVGNLAVIAPGGGRWLITALTAFLHGVGQQWVVFTCGPLLRNTFTRLGLSLLDLGEADPARLPIGEAAQWGNYYAQKPHVMASRVADCYRTLACLMEVERKELRRLWQGAVQVAREAA